jgi:phosphoglycerate dehydrogenase-like enzyme
MIRDVDGVLAGGDAFDESAIRAARRLRIIARVGTGVDQVDVPAATACGIYVTTTPRVNAGAVADLTVGMIIALVRRIVVSSIALRAGLWEPRVSRDVGGMSLGLLGFGAIGALVAARASAHEMKVLAFDPGVAREEMERVGVTELPMRELLRSADVLSLHLPLTPSTRHILGEDAIQQMPVGSYLVNTARGDLVDEEALIRALDRGHIAGAALDVFSNEPPRGMSEALVRHMAVIATPHIAGTTHRAMEQSVAQAVESIAAALANTMPPRAINEPRPDAVGGEDA